ncbi:MAG TPA: hypothetical protein VLE73_02405 [Candidatus Saccharimonadales bacterium]|nr:hypothetical protein [Candidatus Saccharimonadales bacterium]
MKVATSTRLYVDVRPLKKGDTLSYDLSQHLPRRLVVGTVVIVADNPPVFLSVLRKRLARLQTDIERERARTLDRHKRLGLTHALQRLTTARFTTKSAMDFPDPDVLCITPHDLLARHIACSTVYVSVPLTDAQLRAGLDLLRPGGLLAVYGEWSPEYERIVNEYLGTDT